MEDRIKLIEQAINMFGSQTALGVATGFSQHAIWLAVTKGEVSPELAAEIEFATKGKVKRGDICSSPRVFAPLVIRRRRRRDDPSAAAAS